ncbi:MAG: ribonuclease HI family protein [Acidobacteria bacterium]|nr:ribonuclease HI family protein [Acidobacteriota bacterium]
MRQPSPIASSPARMDWIAYIDGGSRGNPGPAGYGVVIQDAAGKTVESLSRSIGKATNNVAEYHALLAALEYIADRDGARLQVYCDSELVVRQMQGRYRVQSPDLKPLHQRARQLAGQLERFAIQHIPREKNHLADQLANEAMDGDSSHSHFGNSSVVQSLIAICEGGRLRPLPPAPALEEGAEYEVKLRKRQ